MPDRFVLHGAAWRQVALASVLACAAGCGRDPTATQPKANASPVAPASGSAALLSSAGDPVGRNIVPLLPTRWVGEPATLSKGQGPRAILIRFWTDTCHYCEKSLPAVEALRQELGPRGLFTVAVYHPKPTRPVTDEAVHTAAERLGYHGPVAIDEAWNALREIWLDGGERRATSASFVLDAQGVVQFVHPGPVYEACADVRSADCDPDFLALRNSVLHVLGGAP